MIGRLWLVKLDQERCHEWRCQSKRTGLVEQEEDVIRSLKYLSSCLVLSTDRVLGVQAEPQSSRAGGDMVQKTGSNGTTIQGVPREEAEEGGGSGLMVLGRLLGQRPNRLL